MSGNRKSVAKASATVSSAVANKFTSIADKADVKMTITSYGNNLITVVASVIRSDNGEPLALTKSSFEAMAVQKPSGWKTSDKLTIGAVSKPTPGIHVFSLSGIDGGNASGPYTIALTVKGKWRGQAVTRIQL